MTSTWLTNNGNTHISQPDNETCQLVEYISREIFFFKNYAQNEAGRLVLDLILFFQSFILGKSKWSAT